MAISRISPNYRRNKLNKLIGRSLVDQGGYWRDLAPILHVHINTITRKKKSGEWTFKDIVVLAMHFDWTTAEIMDLFD